MEKYSLLREEDSYFLRSSIQRVISSEISNEEFHKECKERTNSINSVKKAEEDRKLEIINLLKSATAFVVA